MAENKVNGELAMVVYPTSKELGIGKDDRIALFTIPGQDFYSVSLETGDKESPAVFRGNANIANNNVFITLEQNDYKSGEKLDPAPPVGSIALFVAHRKEAGKGDFLSGSTLNAEQTTEAAALGKSGDTEGLKELRKAGVSITANIAVGHDLINAKKKEATAEAEVEPAEPAPAAAKPSLG